MKDNSGFNLLLIGFAWIIFLFSALSACSETTTKKYTSGDLGQAGKMTAPITISYIVPEKAAVRESVSVLVKFQTHSDADDLKLELTTGEGLVFTSGNRNVSYGSQPANSTFSETVTVVPNTDGILYINVFVTGTFDGRTMVRTGAVPIKAGSDVRKMLKTPGQVSTDAQGEKEIQMRAEEEKEKPK